MPLIKVQTSIAALDPTTIATLLKQLSASLAKHTKKPEAYVMTALESCVSMTFGGTTDPACYIEIKSIGSMNPAQTQAMSQDFCQQVNQAFSHPNMNWHLLGLSFITVFLAELGDKSQLAAIALSGSNCKSPKAVFLGTIAALILASLIGVLVGEGTAQVLPTRLAKAIAAIGFAVLAIRLLWFSAESEEAEAESAK